MPKTYVYARAEDLGIPVVDAKERTFVAVTADDVIQSKKANSKHCALARAALRLPGVVAAYFFRTSAFLEYEKKMVRYNLPMSVQKEIVSFDRAQIFAPGAYMLSPLGHYDSRAYKNKQNKRRRAGGAPKAPAARSRAERSSLKAAIDRVVQMERKEPVTPEEKQFERMMSKLEAVTNPTKPRRSAPDAMRMSAVLGKDAPTPLKRTARHFSGKSQYVRDLHEPKETK